MTALDPQFAKVVRLMRSTQNEGERNAARLRAGVIAARSGLTYDQALKLHDAPAAPPPKPKSMFEGFDDFMEGQEPGWKVKKAAEKAERNAAWAVRRAAILAKYGSRETALAPCWRERLILTAVAPWRKISLDPQRPVGWTNALDSYRHWPDPMPAHVLDALANAYPLPATFIEAKAEHDYWRARNDELDDLFSENGAPYGDYALDMAAQARADMIRDLVEKEIRVTTLADLHARFAMMIESQSHDHEMEKALFRDLSAMVEQQAGHPSSHASSAGAPLHGAEALRADRFIRIADALRSSPERSDRHIARAFGCSPTTVGNVRRTLIGLGGVRRSIQPGGQTYRMSASRKTG